MVLFYVRLNDGGLRDVGREEHVRAQMHGIERPTFLIDGKGAIRGIWRKVKIPGRVADVLAAVKGL